MNKNAKISLMISLLLVAVLAVGLAMAGPKAGSGASNNECRDGIDNDGDGNTDWPSDTGCSNKNDNDETNCGDNVCEGGETAGSCFADCGVADSCSDTDGGVDEFTAGTVSGYANNQPYSTDDACASASAVTEYYCSGTQAASQQVSCGQDTSNDFCGGDGNVYTNSTSYYCSNGGCASDQSTTLKATCSNGCSNAACNPAPTYPDLVVSDLSFTEELFYNDTGNGTVYNMVRVSATVQNIGDAATAVTYTNVQGIFSQNYWTQALGAGESYTIQATYTCTDGTGHTLAATADTYNTEAESNEGNNQASTYVDCVV